MNNYRGPLFPDDCSKQHNFSFPLPSSLSTPRVRLTPFTLETHGKAFHSIYKSSGPELGKYLPVSFPDYPAFVSFFQNVIYADPNCVLFAVMDNTKGEECEVGERLAGVVGVLFCSAQHRVGTVGFVVVFPKYQRTFVATNAVGAVLKYLLDVPSQGGLGFRRVVWTAEPDNEASIRAAERFGFRKEGVTRWVWCLPVDATVGKQCGEERGTGRGVDNVLFALCWDDWQDRVKEHIKTLITETRDKS